MAGSIWDKGLSSGGGGGGGVTSVNGNTGPAVVLTKSDLGLGNVDNTSDATKNSASVALTNHTIDGGTY